MFRLLLLIIALSYLQNSAWSLSSVGGRANFLNSHANSRRLQPRLTDETLLSSAARELRISAPWNAPRWLWSAAWKLQTWATKHVLHSFDDLIKTDTFLNLSVCWWKAISGNRWGRTNDGGAAYDLLPPWTRLIVSWPLCHLYPNLHHQNVALRTLFLDESLRDVLRACERDCRVLAITLGAGFDTRNLRFLNRRPRQHHEEGEAPTELEMYELDLPAVVAEKAAVLQGRYLKRNPGHAVPALYGADLNDVDALSRSLDSIFAESARRHPPPSGASSAQQRVQVVQVVLLLEATLMYMADERVLPALQACVSRANAFSPALPVKLLFSHLVSSRPAPSCRLILLLLSRSLAISLISLYYSLVSSLSVSDLFSRVSSLSRALLEPWTWRPEAREPGEMSKRGHAAAATEDSQYMLGRSPATPDFLKRVKVHDHDSRPSYFVSPTVRRSSTEQDGKEWHTEKAGCGVEEDGWAIRRGALDRAKIDRLVHDDGGLARGLYEDIKPVHRLKIFNDVQVEAEGFDPDKSLREQVSLLDGPDGMVGEPVSQLKVFHSILRCALQDAKSRRLVSENHHLLKSVLLASRPDCPQQLSHSDFSAAVISQQSVKPLSIIVSLMDRGRLAVPGREDIMLDCGDYIVFGAGFWHAGGAYTAILYPSTHFRLHAYLGDFSFAIPNETVLEDKQAPTD